MPLPCPDPDVLATTLSLLEWEARDVTWKDRNGKTSLMALIQHSGFSGWPPDADLKAMARALVDAGVDLHAQDSSQDAVLLYTENLPRWMGILTPSDWISPILSSRRATGVPCGPISTGPGSAASRSIWPMSMPCSMPG